MLSVIIKTKNSGATLCDTLESVKEADEIIVVDEHSNDDTIDIIKEYKAKIIYADSLEINEILNKTIQEVKNDWIFIVQDDEIVPNKLFFEINQYIENPKKNKFCISLSQKNFYLEKEIKSARKKDILRIFKKDYAEFKNDYSTELKLKQGKIFKLNKNFKINNCYLLKFNNKNIFEDFKDNIQNKYLKLKNQNKNRTSLFLKPLFCFLFIYFIKGALFDGKRGFIYSFKLAIEKFLEECFIYERNIKNDF